MFPVSSAALDKTGNIYITGYTSSTPRNSAYSSVKPYTTFPITAGALNQLAGVASVYVAKFSPSGQTIFSSAFGGTGADTSGTIDIDSTGNIYLTGRAGSTDFPLTAGAFQKNYSQGFAAELSADGSRLTYSTFLGTQAPSAAALDSSGNLLMAGDHYPFNGNFPSAPDAAQPCLDPVSSEYGSDYFLQIDPAGLRPAYGT